MINHGNCRVCQNYGCQGVGWGAGSVNLMKLFPDKGAFEIRQERLHFFESIFNQENK